MTWSKGAALAVALLLAAPLGAVQPDEILADPALEARARALSTELRCVQCRNESIDESNAEIARDLRLLLRERLVAGDSDAQAMQYIVDRYGEFVLLNPRLQGSNLLLWAAGPMMLLCGLGLGWLVIRRRGAGEAGEAVAARPLSADEEARLKELTRES